MNPILQFWLTALQHFIDMTDLNNPAYVRGLLHEIWAHRPDNEAALLKLDRRRRVAAVREVDSPQWYNKSTLEWMVESTRGHRFDDEDQQDIIAETNANVLRRFAMSEAVLDILNDPGIPYERLILEHCVPVSVIQQHLRQDRRNANGPWTNEQWLAALQSYYHIALITYEENRNLPRTRMPEHWNIDRPFAWTSRYAEDGPQLYPQGSMGWTCVEGRIYWEANLEAI